MFKTSLYFLMQNDFIHPNLHIEEILLRHITQSLGKTTKKDKEISKHCDFNLDLIFFFISDKYIFLRQKGYK